MLFLYRYTLAVICALLLLCHLGWSLAAQATTPPQACAGCHPKEQARWQISDHAKAMAPATGQTVLGNFNDQRVTYLDQTAHFHYSQNRYRVTLQEGARVTDYPIPYVFGHYPLQQYLIAMPGGKYQVLGFSWDSRPASEGGQRWYHLHQDQSVGIEDRLHWQQPLQNWNGMCADCHSRGLERHYQPQTDRFATRWQSLNLDCLACHTKHDSPPAPAPDRAQRSEATLETCFSCHSLRSPLTDGFTPDTPYLDQFSPQFLLPELYFADGQIKDEVFVYGSYLQSKKHRAGVQCNHCHDSHSQKLTLAANPTCTQCHSAAHYDQPQHHGHARDSEGARCIACHMPERTYMGVDRRRDHQFSIPRPALAAEFGTPNACLDCHPDQSHAWAAAALTRWHGKTPDIRPNERNYLRFQSGQPLDTQAQLAILDDEHLDIMKRATLLLRMSLDTPLIPPERLKAWVNHPEPLLRLAAVLNPLPLTPARIEILAAGLSDRFRAIRVASAQKLLGVPLPAKHQPAFARASEELETAVAINSWRGEGRLTRANNALRLGQLEEAQVQYQAAIRIDPYYSHSYSNLASLYRNTGRAGLAGEILDQGLRANPSAADLMYSKALHLTTQDDSAAAHLWFERAHLQAPANPDYFYAYLLSLEAVGQLDLAHRLLAQWMQNPPVPHPHLQALYDYWRTAPPSLR